MPVISDVESECSEVIAPLTCELITGPGIDDRLKEAEKGGMREMGVGKSMVDVAASLEVSGLVASEVVFGLPV